MRLERFRFFILAVPLIALLGGVAASFQDSGSTYFMPHAHCYLFNRGLMLLHGWSDLFIGLSYVSISATLTYLVLRSRGELPFHWMMLAFALFIVACGITHFMELWTLYAPQPPYWMAGWIKLVTATASVVTAILLPPLVPKVWGILQGARLAAERKADLEKAYAELSELYQQATQAMPRAESHDLAQIAKEVTVHARELERAKQEAEAANRAKDQFLAVLSHELRTPLTPALAAASDLETADEIDPAELRDSLAMIRRNIALEARLVDDLLDTTRIGKGKLEIHLGTVDLHDTIRHAADMCAAGPEEQRAEIAFRLDAKEHFVRGDDARLAQVFWNLVINAIRFTPPSGRIEIATSNPEPGRIVAEVADNGIGIAAELLTKIFEPFFQEGRVNGRRPGGVGLGLSIAKGLMEAHGGSIRVKSPGRQRGSTFTVELPTTSPATRLASGASAPFAPPRRLLRILLVEDHDDTRRILSRALSRRGHEVKTAASVAEALAAAGSFQPELLVSDLGLPDGVGTELLGQLREHTRLPAIAMSGYGMESDLEQTRLAGFDVHLVKPISIEDLNESIERVANGAPV